MSAAHDVRQVSSASGDDLDAARAMFESAYAASGFLPERTERRFAYRFRAVGDASFAGCEALRRADGR